MILRPTVQCALLWAVVSTAACGQKEAPETGQPGAAAPAPAPARPAGPPEVETVAVISAPLETTVKLPGELRPFEAVNLYPRVNAFVDKVLVDRGSKVKQGDLLARLSAPELASQRTEAESKLRASESTARRLQAAASTEGAVARHDIELAEAQLRADRSRVSSLRSLESYLVLRAPFEGMVTERNVHPGALVGPPTGPSMPPMLRVEQLGRLRLVVAVPEAEAAAVAEGAKAEFAVRAWPDRRFSGVIRRLSHSLDPRTRTMPVELDVDNADSKLAPGMYVEVFWPVRRATPSLFVPPSAVAQTTERTYVLRVREGRLEQVLVTRGVALEARLEVFGELRAGDVVVRRPTEELKPGAAVKVTAPASPAPR